jgi:hypothetical protein
MYRRVHIMTARRLSGSALLTAALALALPAPSSAATVNREGATRVLHSGNHRLRVQVLGPVDPARNDELQRWIAEAADATLAAFGQFPLSEATVRVEQSPSHARSPVPWGQTLRRDGVAVLLYVREDASLEELRSDWTAVHELSHLFHPFLGPDGRWLAEGLASYYQNVLRARVGLLGQDEAWRLLDAGFGRGRSEDSGLPLSELSRRHRGTMRVYWAGAAYWLEADLALRREHGSSLDAVLARYASCCLRGTGDVAPERFVAELDRISGSEVFTSLFRRYVDSTAFPSLDPAYAALGIAAGADGVRFSSRAGAVRLRQAVMGPRPPR